MEFLHCLQAEWIKTRRSMAVWLVLIGAFFLPIAFTVFRIMRPVGFRKLLTSAGFWKEHWMNAWESMAFMLLPIGIILATSLIGQLEYRNHGWKQLFCTPQNFLTIYLSKLSVIFLMLIQFFVLFNVGMYLSVWLPVLFTSNSRMPASPIPWQFFAKQNGIYFLCCLPIVMGQYILSIHFRNFMVPLGAGLLTWAATVGLLSWPHIQFMPYSHTSLYFLKTAGRYHAPHSLLYEALGYFILLLISGYFLLLRKPEKG